MTSSAPDGRYLSMDGLRGLAAVSVVALHLKGYGLFPATWSNPAVDLFFILSGFVIAEVYGSRIGRMGVLQFFKLRMFRLYPSYLLSLLLVALFTIFIALISSSPTHPGLTFRSLAFQSLLLPTPPFWTRPDRAAFVTNGAAWSLFWEMIINLAYAAFLPRLRAWHLVVASALGAAGLAATAWAGGDVLGGSDWQTWQTGGFRVLFGFPLGVLLQRLPRAPFQTPFWILACLAFLALLIPPLIAIFALLPFIVWLATSSTTKSTLVLGLGELSYPVYVLHGPAFMWLAWIAGRVLHLNESYVGPFMLVGVCLGSWFALIIWDRPARRYLREHLGGNRGVVRPNVAIT